MSDIPQLRQAVKLMLDVMPNSPIFSAVQVNDLICDQEGAAAKPQDLESSVAGLVAGVVLTQEQVDSILRLTDSASNDGHHERRDLATGVLHCAKCGLHATLIGRAYRQAKEEVCPNGCGPLWPLTWEQHAHKLETRVAELESTLEADQVALSADYAARENEEREAFAKWWFLKDFPPDLKPMFYSVWKARACLDLKKRGALKLVAQPGIVTPFPGNPPNQEDGKP